MKTERIISENHIMIITSCDEYILLGPKPQGFKEPRPFKFKSSLLTLNKRFKECTYEEDFITYPIEKSKMKDIWEITWKDFVGKFPGSGDDEFFDYIPNYWDQICQLVLYMPLELKIECSKQMEDLIKSENLRINQEDPENGDWEDLMLCWYGDLIPSTPIIKQSDLISLYNS